MAVVLFALTGLVPVTQAAAGQERMVWGCAGAAYFGETREYAHGVLGDDIEYKGLMMIVIEGDDVRDVRHELPAGQVFEDIAPRCADFDGDGIPEAVTIISDAKGGARLAIFNKGEPWMRTPPIGLGNRWLAPIGIADLDGDGTKDVAYVEKPHIGGALRVWSPRNGVLVEIARKSGFSNHRIGEDFITSGIRDCGSGPELVLPNFNWRQLMSVRMDGQALTADVIDDATDAGAVARALACKS